jgi:hypothetical protein
VLTTNGWAFLHIYHPLCAWNTYRGRLNNHSSEEGFISVWRASLIKPPSRKEESDQNLKKMELELELESCRARNFPEQVSRLNGIFCFEDIESAENALRWNGTHFNPAFFNELHISESSQKSRKLDSNWVTYFDLNSNDFSWVSQYWEGLPFPNQQPIWETLVQGEIIVLGTDLRERAYKLLEEKMPDSLCILEISRQAAWVGSTLGQIQSFLKQEKDRYLLTYLIDMRDANNTDFLNKLEDLKNYPDKINFNDIYKFTSENSLGRLPDLTKFNFEIRK